MCVELQIAAGCVLQQQPAASYILFGGRRFIAVMERFTFNLPSMELRTCDREVTSVQIP